MTKITLRTLTADEEPLPHVPLILRPESDDTGASDYLMLTDENGVSTQSVRGNLHYQVIAPYHGIAPGTRTIKVGAKTDEFEIRLQPRSTTPDTALFEALKEGVEEVGQSLQESWRHGASGHGRSRSRTRSIRR